MGGFFFSGGDGMVEFLGFVDVCGLYVYIYLYIYMYVKKIMYMY